MNQAVVEIKKPCHETLENRKPGEKGNYCKTCQITVIDFTNKTPDEISQYLMISETVHCGTFNRKDVNTGSASDRLMSYLQNRRWKFLASLVLGIIILASCRTRLTGAYSWKYSDSPQTLNNTIQPADTLKK